MSKYLIGITHKSLGNSWAHHEQYHDRLRREIHKYDSFFYFLKENSLKLNDHMLVSRINEKEMDLLSLACISHPNYAVALSLRDKYEMREFLADVFPYYSFNKFFINDSRFKEKIQDFLEREKKKMLIKPLVGYYGLGIRIISDDDKLFITLEEVLEETKTMLKSFKYNTSIKHSIMLEEYIENQGVLYVNMYYDTQTNPVITAMSFCRYITYGDEVYKSYSQGFCYTDKHLYRDQYQNVLKLINIDKLKLFDVTLLPMCWQLAITQDNVLIPIEVMQYTLCGYMQSHKYGYIEDELFFNNQILHYETFYNTQVSVAVFDVVAKNNILNSSIQYLKNYLQLKNIDIEAIRYNQAFSIMLKTEEDTNSLHKALCDFVDYNVDVTNIEYGQNFLIFRYDLKEACYSIDNDF